MLSIIIPVRECAVLYVGRIMINEITWGITSIPIEKTTSLQKISHVELLHRFQDLLNAPVADTFSSTMEGMAPIIEETIPIIITKIAIANSQGRMRFLVNRKITR
mmetsp:Transcript_5514/g.11583  ORF Transcript_5514/g.11583 Transcript_5514/m.11583 type:complete len:105 (-) Transcript_5514:590-904(-)